MTKISVVGFCFIVLSYFFELAREVTTKTNGLFGLTTLDILYISTTYFGNDKCNYLAFNNSSSLVDIVFFFQQQ